MNNIIGPEIKNIKGDFHERQMLSFFSNFCKWKCLQHPVDFKKTKSSAKEYGIDAIYSTFDPFLKKRLGILIECRSRGDQKKELPPSKLKKQIEELKEKVKVAGISSTLKSNPRIARNVDTISHGILFLRLGEYDHSLFQETLSKVKIQGCTRGGKFPVILILNNYKVNTFVKFYEMISKEDVKYYYPSYIDNLQRSFHSYLSFTYLCSDIIMGKYKEKGKELYKKFALSFEEPSEEAIDYIRNVLAYFQYLEEEDKIDLFFAEGEGQKKHFYDQMIPKSMEGVKIEIVEKNLQSVEKLEGVFGE